MLGSFIKFLHKSSTSVPVSSQLVHQTSSGIKRNVMTNAPERFYVRNNSSAFDSKIKVENSRFYSGSREDPNYYSMENIRQEINVIKFNKERCLDTEKVDAIKKMLVLQLENFDKLLSEDRPNFENIQASFRFLYSSYSSNPELADVFGRFYHYQTKIYERHYLNNELKFQDVPNLNSAFLGFSIKLKFEDKSNVILHKLDYQTNIDTIKFAHEIAALRAASSLLEKQMYHTADRKDFEQMLSLQGKHLSNFSKQKVADALVEQNDSTFFYKDVKHVHCHKAHENLSKSQISRTTHYDHCGYCAAHIEKIDQELSKSLVTSKREIVLKATRRIFLSSKNNNDVTILNQINEIEYPFTLVITNDNYENH
jgi:hypothetical protein